MGEERRIFKDKSRCPSVHDTETWLTALVGVDRQECLMSVLLKLGHLLGDVAAQRADDGHLLGIERLKVDFAPAELLNRGDQFQKAEGIDNSGEQKVAIVGKVWRDLLSLSGEFFG